MNRKKQKAGIYAVMALIMVWILLPPAAAFIFSLFRKWTGIFPEGFTLANYTALFSDGSFIASLFRSAGWCIVPIVFTDVIVLLALFASAVCFPRLEKYVRFICMIPYMIQGVILSVSIVSLYAGSVGILGSRTVMLAGAYCIIILPYIYQGIRSGMSAADVTTLTDAARMLGASKTRAFFGVVVPNIMPSVAVSSLLAAGIIFGDYVLIRNICGTSAPNMQIWLYQTMKTDSGRAAAVFTVITAVMFIISVAVMVMQKNRRVKNAAERRSGA